MERRRKELALPPITALSGPRSRGTIPVVAAGKPPKLRWSPGQIVKYQGQLYEIMYVYRVQAEPREWRFCLEERLGVIDEPRDFIDSLARDIGAGTSTPRIVYDLFRSEHDAWRYFSDIPANGDRTTIRNKRMQEAQLVASGRVVL